MLHNIMMRSDGKGELVFGDTRIPVQIDSLSTGIDHPGHIECHVAGAIYGAIRTNYSKCYSGTANKFEIKNVIFSNPATIVFWADGTKTVVKCQEDDIYSEEVGLALCFAKKALGNKSNFNNVFKKWVPEVQSDYVYQGTMEITQDIRSSAADALEKLAGKLRRPITPDEV